MNITTIKTRLVHANECTLEALLIESLKDVPEHSIVVISSKIIALCQNRVVDKATITKTDLIKQEADFYTPDGFNKYGHNFTIIHNTFITSAGIDESNVDGSFVLWPADPQAVANETRRLVCQLFNRRSIGIIITDSSAMPSMRAGSIGIMIAHSGFVAVKQLSGSMDLFGRPFKVSKSAIGGGLAAAANVVMGEAIEQTPIAIISDIPFVTFQDTNPSLHDLETTYISPETDLYAPFIQSAPWQRGGGKYKDTLR
jgi:F420-0:gamma-glutamyl ligase